MEIPYVPKASVSKSDEFGKVKPRENGHTPAEIQSAESGRSDSLNLSAKAKTLARLSSAYNKLEDSGTAVKQVQDKFASQGAVALSSEEIVAGILQGTLFQNI